jgi:hypothetical protein
MPSFPGDSNGRVARNVWERGRIAGDINGQPQLSEGLVSPSDLALVAGDITDEIIVYLARRGLMVQLRSQADASLFAAFFAQDNSYGRNTDNGAEHRRTTPPADQLVDTKAVPGDRPSERTFDGEFASQICTQLDPLLPTGPIRELFHLCAHKTRKRLAVRDAAEAIGVAPRKLAGLLKDAGYPGPDEVIRWFRLLHAIWLLSRTPRRSVEAVAKSLSYASGPSLSNTMKSMLGVRSKELANGGGLNLALAHFRRLLREAKPTGATVTPLASV